MAHKKTKVRSHYRKTKKGSRPVKRHTRKIKGGRISGRERQIFTHLSDPDRFNIEYGGALDFNKEGKLEEFSVIKGQKYVIELPDFEVLYHTHPTHHESPPSPEDVYNLISSKKQQAEIIFRDGVVFTIAKTPKSIRTFKNLSRRATFSLLDDVFHKSALRRDIFGRGWERNFKKELEKLGFKVKLLKRDDKSISLDIKPVEDGKRKRIKHKGE